MSRFERQRAPPGATRAPARVLPITSISEIERTQPPHVCQDKPDRKAAARMRKIQEEKRRAAEQEREQKAEMNRLCGEAFRDAATGGKKYGDFLNKTVVELAAHLGIIDPLDEAEDDGPDDDGAYAPEADYGGATATTY